MKRLIVCIALVVAMGMFTTAKCNKDTKYNQDTKEECLKKDVTNREYDHCQQLIRSGEQNLEAGFYSKSMELFKTAKALAEKNNWQDLNFSATIDIGAAFYLILDYGESIKNNMEAYEIAINHQLGKEKETRVLNNIAGVYFNEKNYEKAKEFIFKAYKNALSVKDSVAIGRYTSNLALIANKLNDLKSSESYTDIAFKVLGNYPEYLIMPQMVALERYYMSKNHDKAKRLAKKMLETDSLSNHEKASTLMYLAKINADENNLQQAVNYALQAKQTADWETKADIYKLLSDIYKNNNSLRTSLLYKDSLILAIDSINLATNKRILENSRIKFEIFNYQKTISENNDEIRHQKRVTLYLFIIILLVAVIAILSMWYLHIRNKQKKGLYEKDKKIIELELDRKEKDKLLLEKQVNELEILACLEQERTDKKSRELATKTLFMANQNQLIEKIIASLLTIEKTQKTATLTQQISYLKQMLKDSSKHENFLIHFEEVNQKFINSLQRHHPTLSSNDVRFLSYIYMNLNTKEISSLLNITADSCKRKKIRISQKLGLESSAMLYSYISDI